jgi:hypothetical protein
MAKSPDFLHFAEQTKKNKTFFLPFTDKLFIVNLFLKHVRLLKDKTLAIFFF